MSSHPRTDEPDWLQATRAARDYFRSLDVDAETDWFEFVGEGLSYSTFVSDVEVDGAFAGEIIVRIPAEDGEPGQEERAELERNVRAWLLEHRAELSFNIPRVLYTYPVCYGLAMVEEYAYGDPLDALDPLRWDSAGETVQIAAGLHRFDPAHCPVELPGHDTRREHALEWAEVLERGSEPCFAEARDWAEEHLPPDAPSSLLHGDLLGQNIIVEVDDAFEQITDRWLVDWEAVMRGDPAYDLAIVTRAYRKPLGVRPRDIIDRYNELADTPVSLTEVRIYELGLRASWYFEVVEDEGDDSPHAEQRLQDFRALLRRAQRDGERARGKNES